MLQRLGPAAAAPEERGVALYDYGPTTVFASKHDPRFAYCLYVPRALTEGGAPPELVVVMHGTGRSFVQYRDAFAEFARWHNCLILAPLFPVGVLGDDNRNGFKYLSEGGIRYDVVLLAMVAEVEAKYRLAFARFGLFGYSGGGHFAHRFLLLHPERLWAVSIGAPGSITLPDPTRDFWVGVRDLEARFGRPFRPEAVAAVPTHMVVGAADLETWEITHREGSPTWMPGANEAGRTRPERLRSLKAAFERLGSRIRFDELPNVPHDGMKVLDSVKGFFADVLAVKRGLSHSWSVAGVASRGSGD